MADITGDKIRELLSDPKNIELIANIAGSGLFGGLVPAKASNDSDIHSVSASSEQEAPADTHDLPDATSDIAVSDGLPDLSHPPALQDIAASLPFNAVSGASDKRIALLKAIKPYVSDSKKERVDGLVKAISVAGILSGYTGGLFGNKF